MNKKRERAVKRITFTVGTENITQYGSEMSPTIVD